MFVHTEAPAVDVVPTMQAVHAIEPDNEANVPAAHVVQATELTLSEYIPRGHNPQLVAPATAW